MESSRTLFRSFSFLIWAVGIGPEECLEEFAQARGATIATGGNWQSTVLDALADPNRTVHFNLDE